MSLETEIRSLNRTITALLLQQCGGPKDTSVVLREAEHLLEGELPGEMLAAPAAEPARPAAVQAPKPAPKLVPKPAPKAARTEISEKERGRLTKLLYHAVDLGLRPPDLLKEFGFKKVTDVTPDQYDSFKDSLEARLAQAEEATG